MAKIEERNAAVALTNKLLTRALCLAPSFGEALHAPVFWNYPLAPWPAIAGALANVPSF